VGLDPAVLISSSTSPPGFSALIKQADEVGFPGLIVADGLGWVGEWYDLTGDSSNYVIDQIPGWATEEGKQFAKDFEARWGLPPSPSSAGLAYDAARAFIAIANETIKAKGELTSASLHEWAQENFATGKWTYKNGIIMGNYEYRADTIPDPVVGQGYYIFPVLQYFDGVGKVIYPPEWAEQQLQPKP
jgi:branched-chain amino acid transport system substrate-binding protein